MCDRNVPPANPDDVEEELKQFRSVVAAFKHYRTHSKMRIDKTEACLNNMHRSHQDVLTKYRDHLHRINYCINENYKVLCDMIKYKNELFEDNSYKIVEDEWPGVRLRDMEAVQITLKQIARDWSDEGEEERQQCYDPIINEIVNFYSPEKRDISKIKILVPGAGLGRLTFELAYRGYYCEGNEFSFFMLIASNFILNKCTTENQYTIHPWVHQYVNNVNRSDQIAPVSFPDVSPTETPAKGMISMVAGDFLQVYTDSDYWDCVATCFFIDCANNVIEFIETIYRILKPGAIWVNLGPLLYHYSDIGNEFSIEPTYEDLIGVIESVGFKILKSQTGIRTKYAQNPRSMQQSEYLSVFCVCQKPAEIEINGDMHNGMNGMEVNSEDYVNYADY